MAPALALVVATDAGLAGRPGGLRVVVFWQGRMVDLGQSDEYRVHGSTP